MSKVMDGGIVTAYGAAVRGGYTGTYQQFCAALGQLTEVLEEFEGFSVEVTTLSPGAPATANYHDGVLTLGIPRGETGNGIQSAVLNSDYTLTLTWTNGQHTTVGPIRGAVGATPNLTIGNVQTLQPSQPATATITGTPEDPVLNFGIPKGDPGTNGVSPAVTITEITDGHRVTITDGDHPQGQSFDVMDGQDGASDAGDVTYDETAAYQSGTVGAELSSQKNAISYLDENIGLKSPAYYGNVSSSLTWNNIASTYQHIVIPCEPNDTVVFVGSARYIFVSDYSAPVLGASVNPLNSSMQVVSNGTRTSVAPALTKYLVVMVVYNGIAYTCDIRVNGISVINPITKTLAEINAGLNGKVGIEQGVSHSGEFLLVDQEGNVAPNGMPNQIISANQKNICNAIEWLNGGGLNYLYAPFEGGTWKYSASIGTATEKIVYGGYVRSSDYIYLPDGATILQKTSGAPIRLIKVDTAYIVSGKITTHYNEPYVLEAGYYVFDIQTNDIAHINDYYSITIPTARFPDQPTVNWLAMGDSITQGWYSYFDETATGGAAYSIDADKGWAKKVANYNGWNLTNMAIGGTGFLNNSGSYEHTGAYLGLTTDFSQYNLVTISYGINDWKGNQYPLGNTESVKGTYVNGIFTPPTEIAGAIKTLIEGIYASNPNCKVILITPIQAAGYASPVSGRHTYEDSPRMSLSYRQSNTGTLLEFVDMMKSIAEYYGIEYIDMTLGSEVNFLNALTALPDGIHPSLITHELLARELRKKIHQ